MNEERPIEKLLRCYAKKRRDQGGPPPELHPATRRLLQGEVARQYPAARPARTGGFLALLRARWIYATACLVVVGIGIVVLRLQEPGVAPLADNTKEFSLAKAVAPEPGALLRDAAANRPLDKLEAASASVTPAVAPIVASETAVPRAGTTTRLSFDDANAQRASEAQPVVRTLSEPDKDRYGIARTAPTAASPRADESLALRPQSQPPATIPTLAFAESKTAPAGLAGTSTAAEAGKGVAVTMNPTATPPPPARVSPRPPASEARARNTTLARDGDLERDNRSTLSQSFANAAGLSATDNAKPWPAANILMNFRVEQAGDQVRVIDGDGSTYLGVMPDVTAEAAAVRGGKQDAASFRQENRIQTKSYFRQAGEAEQAGQYLYRVEGTNRTLNQAVAFAWNFVAPTNAPGAAANVAGGNLQSLLPVPWTEAAINGRVQINTGEQFEVNAAPVKR